MATLAVLRPPASMRSGDDVLGEKTTAGLTFGGLSAELFELWPEWWAAHLWHSRLPFHRRLFDRFPARWRLRELAGQVHDCSAVWINGSSLPVDSSCAFERSRIRAGQDFIFHLQDDWFSIPGARNRAEAAAKLARLIVVPTIALQERVLSFFPHATTLALEEPIDIHRFTVSQWPDEISPFLVWTGNPNNLKEIPGLGSMLQKLYREAAFTLRIISGKKKPHIEIGVPWEWYPHSQASEGHLLAGAVAGLAPMMDTPYARCKGSYKVKTYLAAGIPTVASPVGHQGNLIVDSETGFVVRDESAWLDRLAKLLCDRALASAMGRNARKFAMDHLSHEVLMPQWARALRKELGYGSWL